MNEIKTKKDSVEFGTLLNNFLNHKYMKNLKWQKTPQDRKTLESLDDDYVCLNGNIVRMADLQIPLSYFMDYGAAVWDGGTARADFDGEVSIYGMKAMIKRLIIGGESAGFIANDEFPNRPKLPFDEAQMEQAIYETLAANNNALHYIRPFMFLGGMQFGVPISSGAPVHWGVKVMPLNAYYPNGIDVLVCDRYGPDYHIAAKGIAGKYSMSALIRELAGKYGCKDGITGATLPGYTEKTTGEGSTNNLIFIDKDHNVVLPRPAGYILYGRSVQTAKYLLEQEGYNVITRDIFWHELTDGTFIAASTAGNAAGITTIKSLVTESNERILLDSEHPILEWLKKQYEAFIRIPDAEVKIDFIYSNVIEK